MDESKNLTGRFDTPKVDTPNGVKVSIIVPVYNAGKRIKHCLETLIAQTLSDIEIICVLDCPSDGTDRIVKEYASHDSRIKVIENDHNMHISATRNRGLAVASGEYVGFSDHDDYRDLAMYEKLYAKAKTTSADIVFSDVIVYHEDGSVSYEVYGDSSKEGIIQSLLLPMASKRNVNPISRSCWHSIYKKSLLEQNSIEFPDRNTFFEEDTLFNLQTFLCSETIAYCQERLYVWDKHLDSESNKWATNIAPRTIRQMEFVVDCLKQHQCFNTFKDALYEQCSEWINRYYAHYQRLTVEEKKAFRSVIRRMDFPVGGRRYSLKLLSKKRVKLFFYILKTKYLA